MKKKIFEPLRVVKEPVLVDGLRRKELLYLLSDGNFYRQRDLAKKIGICPEAMRARAARMHWSHPDFLSPSKTSGKRGKAVKRFKPRPEGIVDFAAMGKNPRKSGLVKLGGPGRFERSL